MFIPVIADLKCPAGIAGIISISERQ